MYDRTIGRWISEDPMGFEAADPNLYRFVGNKPTDSADPSGLRPNSELRVGIHVATTPVACAQQPAADPFTSGANSPLGGLLPLRWFGGTRAETLSTINRIDPAPLPRIPGGWTYSRVAGGFRHGVLPANTVLGPSGCGPCVGVVIYPVTVARLPTYAFHFAYDPGESPVSTFQTVIVRPNANWGELRGDYRAVLCGAEIQSDAATAAQSAGLLSAVVNAIRNELRVQIRGYVPGPSIALGTGATIYWAVPAGAGAGNY